MNHAQYAQKAVDIAGDGGERGNAEATPYLRHRSGTFAKKAIGKNANDCIYLHESKYIMAQTLSLYSQVNKCRKKIKYLYFYL